MRPDSPDLDDRRLDGGTVPANDSPCVRRLSCDQMLTRLGKWLRAAGHDTAIAAPGDDDGDVLARARAEERILLTCDRKLKRERAPEDARVVVLATSQPDAAARELAARLGLDWLAAPFTRCMEDNTLLRPAEAGEVARLPERARALPGPRMRCPSCGRMYWPGSHVRRMRRRLSSWQQCA